MVDGALGMAYGVSATTLLMSLGVPPAAASVSVHAADVFTTAASGTVHWRLVWPGMMGGVIVLLSLRSLAAMFW